MEPIALNDFEKETRTISKVGGNSKYWLGQKLVLQLSCLLERTHNKYVHASSRCFPPGLVTTGSSVSYMESYSLQFSKDRKSWKTYKDAMSKEKKVGVPPCV